MSKMGSPYGAHRVLEPAGVLPQAAWRLSNDMEPYDNEILVEVEALNVDAASFTQIRREAGDDLGKIASIIQDITLRRGKLHNPVTGSGGMFIGRVAGIGPALAEKHGLREGDRVASMVSLSLTPLVIDQIKRIHLEKAQVEIQGRAILFETGISAPLPDDLDAMLSLAVLDVAGAPAQTARLVRPGDTVLVVGGGGKSGLLCLFEARRRAGINGRVIGVDVSDSSCERMRRVALADEVLQVSATDPLTFVDLVGKSTGGRLADVTISCVNIAGAEMACILATREGGTVYFFSMATSFTAAALGAEGVGKDVQMLIGNGYAPGHAAMALQIMREAPLMRTLFEELYV